MELGLAARQMLAAADQLEPSAMPANWACLSLLASRQASARPSAPEQQAPATVERDKASANQPRRLGAVLSLTEGIAEKAPVSPSVIHAALIRPDRHPGMAGKLFRPPLSPTQGCLLSQ
jgi:hypothetical protein